MNPRVIALVVIALVAVMAGMIDLTGGKGSVGSALSNVAHPSGIFTKIGDYFGPDKFENVDLQATLTYDSINVPLDFQKGVSLTIDFPSGAKMFVDGTETILSQASTVAMDDYKGKISLSDLIAFSGETTTVQLGSVIQTNSEQMPITATNESYNSAFLENVPSSEIKIGSVSGIVQITSESQKLTGELSTANLELKQFEGSLSINTATKSIVLAGKGTIKTDVFETIAQKE